MDDATAVEILKVLHKKGGHLKIVTNQRSDVPDGDLVARHGNPLADPKAWVIHDVVRLDGPDGKATDEHSLGRMQAVSEEGDRTIGYPAALLWRLTVGAK